MKCTSRQLLFFKGIFNGRVEDASIAGTFTSADAATKIPSHAAAPTAAVYPKALNGSAFVFPYGTSCFGTINGAAPMTSSTAAAAAAAADATSAASVTFDGKWKRVLTPNFSGSHVSKLSAFHNGQLYQANALVDTETSSVAYPTGVTASAVATAEEGKTAAAAAELIVKDANLYIAKVVSAAIYELAVTAARHTTAVAEFDQYLCHNQVYQKNLSIIETSRYALDSLALSTDAEDSALVAVFARLALKNAVDAANSILGNVVAQHPEMKTRPHPSSSASLSIDYTSLAKAQKLLSSVAINGGASDADCGLFALGDLFGKDSQKVKPPSMFSKSNLHLSPTHGNATGYVNALQDELATFPSAVLKPVSAKNKVQVKKAAEIASELLATVAVLHRFSAAIGADLEGEGRVQASIAPAFCSLSAERRSEALRTITALRAAGKAGKPAELDDASIHPSQYE